MSNTVPTSPNRPSRPNTSARRANPAGPEVEHDSGGPRSPGDQRRSTGQEHHETEQRARVAGVPWTRGLIPGVSIAVVTLAVVQVSVLLAVIAGGSADLSWGSGLGLGAQLWLLSLGIPLEVSVAPLAGVAAQTGVVSLAPLGLSLLTAGLAFAAGSGLARRAPYGAGLAPVVLTTGVVHAVVAGIIALVTRGGVAQANPLHALAMGGVIVVVATAIGALIGGGTPAALVGAATVERARRAGQEMRWAGSYLWAVLRAAVVAALAGIAVGAVVLAIAVSLGWQQIVTIQQQLGSDAAGDTVFFVLHLALLPNFVIWTLSWASGAGFYLGQGALVSPAGSSVETLPLLPIFGALPPQDAPVALAAIPALVVLCGVLAGWWFVREGENHLAEWIAIRIPWRVLSVPLGIVATGVLIGAVTALLVAALLGLASGSLGVGRMDLVGPLVWEGALVIGAEVALGAALGAAVGPWAEQSRAVRSPVPTTTSPQHPIPSSSQATPASVDHYVVEDHGVDGQGADGQRTGRQGMDGQRTESQGKKSRGLFRSAGSQPGGSQAGDSQAGGSQPGGSQAGDSQRENPQGGSLEPSGAKATSAGRSSGAHGTATALTGTSVPAGTVTTTGTTDAAGRGSTVAKPSRGALERDREAQRRSAIAQKQRDRIQQADQKAQKRYAAAEKRRQRRKAARDR
ncbi:cell division protein PerM [Kocuria sp.]|uniref:cell division protein PerM n=1 Tax=Kocuria sp. TaxID=1871328 RepID=UPI0026DF3686|nr:DUF6350 family protein [Kocuria sp.]MDO5617580.1 DUF6350 family protein [Kocuria sp.]